jgi:chemotaxis protein methyltransferase CheR
VKDADCVAFLQWALPRLGLSWAGFRKVRRQVCRRVAARMESLGLRDVAAYRARLDADRAEWQALGALCTVSISRFYRDGEVFDCLGAVVLPALARAALGRRAARLECWSAGCASGEEPYTIAILWRMSSPIRGLALRILATDVDATLLERARAACYRASSLKELPPAWRWEAFEPRGRQFCLRDEYRRRVELERQDLASELPQREFDLVLCRNLAFTYFGEQLARGALEGIASRLRSGGALVVGIHEKLPQPTALEPWPGCRAVFRRHG